MRIKRFLLVLGLASFTVYANAQSSTDIEAAKQAARAKGYSDAQIAAMASAVAGGSASMSKSAAVATTSSNVVDRNIADYSVATLPVVDVPAISSDRSGIFGHDLFRNKNLNFIPSYNVPTPENYKLSAGDEIVIDIWGDVISNITTKISPEGSVNIPNLGPVYISGQTVTQAEKTLKSYLSKIYSGIAQPEPSTFVKLALGKTKTVTINVVGDVAQPGSYTLPSLSTIASAMYLAGGPSSLGTVRNIQLYRNNKLKSTLDAYDFILNGKFDANIRLEDNDVIIVGPYAGVVTLNGGVKRPMRYEIKEGESIEDIVGFAGGFADKAYIGSVHVSRVSGSKDQLSGATNESYNVPADQFASFKLQGGDVVSVDFNNDRYKNSVSISGSVWRPGTFSINAQNSNLKQLIQNAGGLREDAFVDRGAITRLDENRIPIHIHFNVNDVIIGKENINLHPDDQVVIYSIHSLKPNHIVRIYGEVNNPTSRRNYRGETGTYEFKEGMTIADLILMAGGITDAATLAKVEVARRNVKSDIEELGPSDVVAEVMHFNLLKNPADADVKLKPFDIVFVRRNPTYKAQQSVAVTGEVNYPGTYVVESSTVRLSDVIGRAQGFTNDAYVKGAKLTRTLNKEEFDRLKVAMEIAKKQANDSTAVDSLEIGESYTVAIDLARAIAEPGSVADVILREGDVISVPKYNSTVKISGAVMYPNVVSFDPKKSWNYYLSNAGGVIQDGVKRKVYMVHMNGSVATKGDANFKVQPGTEIIIPAKNKQQGGQNLASIMSIATSTASLAAMITTIVNQMK